MCSEHMPRVVVVGFRPHCDCPQTVLNTLPTHDMATLSSISAISSIFLPNWMLMESWCHWVAIDVRIHWRGLFYMMHYLKVCFHMTYPFLNGWDITNNIIVGDVSAMDFSLALLSHENGMEILFSRIDSSSHTAVSCDLGSYCLCLHTVLYLLIYFLVLIFLLLVVVVLYFQISHLEPFFTDTVFRFSFHDSVSGFHIAGLVFCSQSCSEILFFLAAEGMLI